MFDSLRNQGDYFSRHYLAEILPKQLRDRRRAEARARQAARGAGAREADRRQAREHAEGLLTLTQPYFAARTPLDDGAERFNGTSQFGDSGIGVAWRKRLHEIHTDILKALGFQPRPAALLVERVGRTYTVQVAHSESGIVAIECGWAIDADAAMNPDGAGRLAAPVDVFAGDRPVDSGVALASFLLSAHSPDIRYVLILVGGVVVLADAAAWGEGRYLAVSLDTALSRGAVSSDELDMIRELFGAASLRPPEEGGDDLLTQLRRKSGQHAVGVSKDLREGLRESVEIIANEVLERMRDGHLAVSEVYDPKDLADRLAHESLRYLYRVLFLLYAEARPELGILPPDDRDVSGYRLERLGDLLLRDLVGEQARSGTYLYQTLDLLFRLVDKGHRPRNGTEVAQNASEGLGIRFEPLRSELFGDDPDSLIGTVENPLYDPDSDDPRHRHEFIDTRLRNAALYKVLRLLMLTKGKSGKSGGFISYANLGINQLGAVYEGLMSYTGFIKDEEQYEVAKKPKKGKPPEGSWLVPKSRIDDYTPETHVRRFNEPTGTWEVVPYPAGSFVYRLAGRDRQASASYYTPAELTKATVQLALKHRLDQPDAEGKPTQTAARELLTWRMCEPALGSGAFLNEAVNQVAEEYLRRRQEELKGVRDPIDPDKHAYELQKVKAYLAIHRGYGVDLNATALELAEVSLWLNVMHPGLRAPWFGLHLRRGNSLIGARRRYLLGVERPSGSWEPTETARHPMSAGVLPEGAVYHFLLPAGGWGSVAASLGKDNEVRRYAKEEAYRLKAWRGRISRDPSAKRPGRGANRKPSEVDRLQALSRRAEFLWDLVVQRLEISERDVSRRIDVWGADDLEHPDHETELRERKEILAALQDADSPYSRLKLVMDAWCAMWVWPVHAVGLLDGTDDEYPRQAASARIVQEAEGKPEAEDLFGESTPLPGRAGNGSRSTKSVFDDGLRPVIPLAELADWLDFAEAVLGRIDIDDASLAGQHFETLTQLDEYEASVRGWTGMQPATRLVERFPWLRVVRRIAKERGFFHWELEFAQIFKAGGFDLQVGNPPWVRPEWEPGLVLAEHDPWFALEPEAAVDVIAARRERVLADSEIRQEFLDEYTANVAVTAFLNSFADYPLLAKTQPDFYRAFMCRVWEHTNLDGTSGLIHPDTHFEGGAEAALRATAYRRLRVHGSFVNRANWAFEASRNTEFGLHIYGREGDIHFQQASHLTAASTLIESLAGVGAGGELPGIKYRAEGEDKVIWDKRPHPARIVTVDYAILTIWQDLRGSTGETVDETPLLYPLSTAEDEALLALAEYPSRLGEVVGNRISSGFHEKGAKAAGVIERASSQSRSWPQSILRGPHIGVSTPFHKQAPRLDGKGPLTDLATAADDFVPMTDYANATTLADFEKEIARDSWIDHVLKAELHALTRERLAARFPDDELLRVRLLGDEKSEPVSDEHLALIVDVLATKPYSAFYRMAWREWIADNGERSLFTCLLPPGPSHVHSIRSAALQSPRPTVLIAGFWSSIPVEYVLRATGRRHLDVTDAKKMPVPDPDHPLAESLLLRTLRLNCLSTAYADLWSELYSPSWSEDTWAFPWPELSPLSTVTRTWERATPLRTEYARRAALVEIDALAAVMLDMSADALISAYRSRFGVLENYESEMFFSAEGRKLAGNWNTFGHGQTKNDYDQLLKHLDDEDNVPPPNGFSRPFYRAAREEEMRHAHRVFTERLNRARQADRPAQGGDAA